MSIIVYILNNLFVFKNLIVYQFKICTYKISIFVVLYRLYNQNMILFHFHWLYFMIVFYYKHIVIINNHILQKIIQYVVNLATFFMFDANEFDWVRILLNIIWNKIYFAIRICWDPILPSLYYNLLSSPPYSTIEPLTLLYIPLFVLILMLFTSMYTQCT